MPSFRLHITWLLIAILYLVPAATGQTNTRELKGKVFEVKHRDPKSLLNVIRPLASPSKEASMSHSDEFNTITVRDYAENIASMEEAIKRLDTQEPPQASVELMMHVIIASKTEGVGNKLPPELNEVARQLGAAFNYKSFHHATSIIQRLKDGTRNARGKGVIELGQPIISGSGPATAGYELGIESLTITNTPTPPPVVKIREFQYAMGNSKSSIGEASIRTDLSVRDGEQIVVGTASLKDKALVMVLSVKIITAR